MTTEGGKVEHDSRICVKRVFALAKIIKERLSNNNFKIVLTQTREEVLQMTEEELNGHLEYQGRKERYDACDWKYEEIDLNADIAVWPDGFGERKLKGVLREVVICNKDTLLSNAKIKSMLQYHAIYQTDLPIITVHDKNYGWFIDDGCHRAVSLCLQGIKKVNAWVGRPKAR